MELTLIKLNENQNPCGYNGLRVSINQSVDGDKRKIGMSFLTFHFLEENEVITQTKESFIIKPNWLCLSRSSR